MSEQVNLLAVLSEQAYTSLRKYSQVTGHPHLRKLVEPNTLTWTEVEQLLESQALNQDDYPLSQWIQVAISVKAVDAIREAASVTPHQCEVLCQATDALAQAVPGIDLREEVDMLAAVFTLTVLRVNSWRVLEEFAHAAKLLEARFPETSILAATINQHFSLLLLRCLTSEPSLSSLKENLEDLSGLDTPEADGSLSILVDFALCQMPLAPGSLAEKKELVILLLKLLPEDDRVKTVAEEFKI